MAYETEKLGLKKSDANRIEQSLDRLINVDRPRFGRLWTYYANPMTAVALDGAESGSCRPYQQGQEWGLPRRITGAAGSSGANAWPRLSQSSRRKEVVIENDIGWRINTMVEYLFGQEVGIESTASDPAKQQFLTRLLRRVLANHGGIIFLQQLALLGCVHGFVDVVVKLDTQRLARAVRNTVDAPPPPRDLAGGGDAGKGAEGEIGEGAGGSEGALPRPSFGVVEDGSSGTEVPPPVVGGRVGDGSSGTEVPPPVVGGQAVVGGRAGVGASGDVEWIAQLIRLEIVQPGRAMPVVSDIDPQVIQAYAQVWEQEQETSDEAAKDRGGFISRWLRGKLVERWTGVDQRNTVVEIISPTRWQRYRDGELESQGENSLGRIPLAHIQNLSLPFSYSGASDVEPLIPLQDELNTRMSDRANRITLQSFKMYLGKGIDGFLEMPIAPGRMWATDNDSASVQEFGGDSSCPSEDAHIADIREAMDKTSGVTGIAAGSIKDRIGNLSSAAALRITLLALLSKNEKKRATYGEGIRQICELILAWLDVSGVVRTTPAERQVKLYWADPLPGDQMQAIQEAQAKLNLGVAKEVVLKELGY